MYKFIWCLFLLVSAYADNSIDADAIASQQLLKSTQQEQTLNNTIDYNSSIEKESVPILQKSNAQLDKDNTLLNPDGTLGVAKDTKMQVTPNSVNFKFGY